MQNIKDSLDTEDDISRVNLTKHLFEKLGIARKTCLNVPQCVRGITSLINSPRPKRLRHSLALNLTT